MKSSLSRLTQQSSQVLRNCFILHLTNSHAEVLLLFFFILHFVSSHSRAWENLLFLCLVSACVGIWTETHKICQAWVLINQILPRCFCSNGLWSKKSNYRVKQIDISEPTDVNQSITMNRFYPMEALIFIRNFFVFL